MSANSASFGSVFSEKLHLLHLCGASSCLFCDHLSCGNQKDSSSCSGFGNYSVRVCACVCTPHSHHGIFPLAELNMWQSSWRADPCLSVSALPFNPADVHVGLLLFLPPSAVFHLRTHNCLARPTAALEPKQTQCIKKKKSFNPVHQAPVKVQDLGKSCFTQDFPLHFCTSQTTASTLAPHNVKVCYATKYLTLFFQKTP